MMDLEAVQQVAIQAARDAGAVAMQYFGGTLQANTKQSSIDVVTKADKEAEVIIVDALLKQFPNHHIVGEEGGGQGAPAEVAEYSWHVDPLDGTTNFANGIPHFCTSIALADKNMTPVVAVVYNPYADELFTAVHGEPTTLNGKPTSVSQSTTLINSVLSTGFPYNRQTNPDNNIANWAKLMLKTRTVRYMGSAALNFAFVAAGRFDGYWEFGINTWDSMAGILLVLNAGGKVTNFHGDASSSVYTHGQYIATNGHIHEQLMHSLNGG